MAKRATKTASGPYGQFLKAMVADGAKQCPSCWTYVGPSHEFGLCCRIPAVSQRWLTSNVVAPQLHHDPIDRDWTELEAEVDNAQAA